MRRLFEMEIEAMLIDVGSLVRQGSSKPTEPASPIVDTTKMILSQRKYIRF
jgi:hypothetical protein